MQTPLWLFALAAALCAGLRVQDHKRISHDTYYLGAKPHPEDSLRSVEGYAFLHLHHTSAAARAQQSLPPTVAKHNHFARNFSLQAECSAPIADGANWRRSRGYFINARNAQFLSEAYLVKAIAEASDAWRCVLNQQRRMVIGPLAGVRSTLSGRDMLLTEPTGENTVGLGLIQGKPGTVAVTVVWGIFSGPVAFREISEFKMLFDETNFRFGNSSVARNVIDFGATATHEWGHALGLDDIYLSQCADVTMYGTSIENEVKKRTLELEDSRGLQLLYPRV